MIRGIARGGYSIVLKWAWESDESKFGFAKARLSHKGVPKYNLGNERGR
jgi:hypothetical protein